MGRIRNTVTWNVSNHGLKDIPHTRESPGDDLLCFISDRHYTGACSVSTKPLVYEVEENRVPVERTKRFDGQGSLHPTVFPIPWSLYRRDDPDWRHSMRSGDPTTLQCSRNGVFHFNVPYNSRFLSTSDHNRNESSTVKRCRWTQDPPTLRESYLRERSYYMRVPEVCWGVSFESRTLSTPRWDIDLNIRGYLLSIRWPLEDEWKRGGFL